MTATLLVLTTALAFPPDLRIPSKDPYVVDKDYHLQIEATSQTGRTLITGTRVDVMVVEGFRTGRYTRKFVIEDVRVAGIQPTRPLFGKPMNMVTVKVSDRQMAELELAAEKGQLIVTLHPLVLKRPEEIMTNTGQKGLLKKRYTDRKDR